MPFFSETTFQPKRSFRFLVNFSKIANIDFMCTTADKPAYQLGDGVSHKILNHTFKFPGTVTWNDVKINFIDAVDPNVGSRFYNMLINAGYAEPITPDRLLQGVTKFSSNEALGSVKIMQLDGGTMTAVPGGDPGVAAGTPAGTSIIEEWTLNNAYIKDVNFGSLSYSDLGS
jgi:hypothetical protein